MGSQTTWNQITLSLKPTASSNSTANNFTVTFDAANAAGQTINFAMFSLFPPTFKNRENGMSIDLANVGGNLNILCMAIRLIDILQGIV